MAWLSFRLAYFAGKDALEKKELEKAESKFKKSLSIFPGHRDAQLALAQTLRMLDRKDEVGSLLKELLEEYPDFVYARVVLAEMAEERVNHDQAREELECAVRSESKNMEIWHKLGRVYLRLNREAEALAAFHKVTRLDPFMTPYRLAVLQEKMAASGKS